MILKEQILIRLRETIKKSNLTIKEIADRLGLDCSIVNSYLSDDILPPPEIFANLCDILEVSADYIFCLK